MRRIAILCVLLAVISCYGKVNPPAPYGPIPSARQLAWHNLNFYAFIHLTTNTFNDMEWGYGDADPNIFNPTELDAEQWMRALKAAGMKGVILTCKHHDGFCLWPTELSDYSVKNSQWRDGKGDVPAEVSKAARKYGLKFGIYLSPWDRHDMRYGTPEYIDYYRGQFQELSRRYGPLFEVWQDGANGGDGYYGGLKEERKIDNRVYYDWKNTNYMIREMEPQACIFSDGGPDCRWCGNEEGHIGETNWGTITRANFAPGHGDRTHLRYGDEEGTDWVPAEVDVSIRPGWFFHETENSKVKTVEQLMDIYYTSIGRGANLILNIPPNKQGLFNEEDVKALEGLGAALKQEFSNCLNGKIAKAEASNERGGSKEYGIRKAIDGKDESYWATDDEVREATLTFTFRQPTKVNRAMLREYLPLGQRISQFTLEAQTESGQWKEVGAETTIGNKRLLRFPDITAQALRINIKGSKACPILSDVKFYCSPNPIK